MARLFLFLVMVLVVVGIVAILLSIWNAAMAAGSRAPGTLFGLGKDHRMAPSGLQKVAFIALIALLCGVSLGWLGGL